MEGDGAGALVRRDGGRGVGVMLLRVGSRERRDECACKAVI